MVAAEKAPEPSNTRLTLGPYIADVLLDSRHNARIYHWIVQKMGSPEIVFWGQEHSFEQATSAARACLQELADKDQRQA